jgi:hypothetical protein
LPCHLVNGWLGYANVEVTQNNIRALCRIAHGQFITDTAGSCNQDRFSFKDIIHDRNSILLRLRPCRTGC